MTGPLEIADAGGTGNGMSFHDERAQDLRSGAIGSVTMHDRDGVDSETWGQFVTRDDALRLFGWLALLLER